MYEQVYEPRSNQNADQQNHSQSDRDRDVGRLCAALAATPPNYAATGEGRQIRAGEMRRRGRWDLLGGRQFARRLRIGIRPGSWVRNGHRLLNRLLQRTKAHLRTWPES
jgi:hypothetical protein